jgi:hypothetical protein
VEKPGSVLMGAFVALLLLVAAAAMASAQDLTPLVATGKTLTNADPLALELRNREAKGPRRRGFHIGMAAAQGQTLPGPGKDRIRASLSSPAEQQGFDLAVSFSLERNRFAALAATGAAIARQDPVVAAARAVGTDVFFRLGFDIATGIFGDPALGARGNTATGPGSLKTRDSLSAAGQRGFNASVTLHLSRRGTPTAGLDLGATVSAAGPKSQTSEIYREALKAPFIGNVQVAPGWRLVISFTSTQQSKPLVEVGSVAPVRDGAGILSFPGGSGAVSRFVSLDAGRYYLEFDVLREGFEASRPYYYIINVFNDNPSDLQRPRDQATGRFTMAAAGTPGYVCDGGHFAYGVDGSAYDCSPFMCQAGQCLKFCASVNDCVRPSVCSPRSFTCVPASSE